MHHVVKCLTLSLTVAAGSAGIGYLIASYLVGGSQFSSPLALGAGLFIGVVIGSLLNRQILSTRSLPTDAQPLNQQAHASKTTPLDVTNERKTVFIGNLAFRTSPRQLREVFEAHGTVHSVRIATDRNTRKPRGFGFVEMSVNGADKAILTLNGYVLNDRALNLSEAKHRETQA